MGQAQRLSPGRAIGEGAEASFCLEPGDLFPDVSKIPAPSNSAPRCACRWRRRVHARNCHRSGGTAPAGAWGRPNPAGALPPGAGDGPACRAGSHDRNISTPSGFAPRPIATCKRIPHPCASFTRSTLNGSRALTRRTSAVYRSMPIRSARAR